MKYFRFLLIPFSLLYGSITACRNLLFNWGIFKTRKSTCKSILVGNLSVGGTGKTPHVDFLVENLKDKHKLATLSRGYGRKTRGFIKADTNSDAEQIGDEPMQYHLKHPEINVYVCEKRAEAINVINKENDLLIYDDAYQHRAITADLQILLTEYNRPFSEDFVLPTGRLREFKCGKKRADIVVVSKSPNIDHSKIEEETKTWKKKLGLKNTPLFFSSIEYKAPTSFNNSKLELPNFGKILLVTSIANTSPLLDYLESKKVSYTHLKFKDHHSFTKNDIEKIETQFQREKFDQILCTEKDMVKLFKKKLKENANWYYLPIGIQIQYKEKEFLCSISK